MATTPPTELPPFPSDPGPGSPGQPDGPAPEFEPVAPDIDIPSPGGDPGGEPFQPMDDGAAGAASTAVGAREPGDTDDIGSTRGMAASFGGLAGTSR